MEREKGLEPSTFWLETRSSTIELLPRLGGGTPLAPDPYLVKGLSRAAAGRPAIAQRCSTKALTPFVEEHLPDE